MKFHYRCNVRPGDFWRMSLSHTYHSPAGVVNAIFTVAVLVLAIKVWGTAPDWVQVLLLLAVLLFPVIQPVMLYFRCKAQVLGIPADLKISIEDAGLVVSAGGKNETIRWNRVKSLIEERNMLILRVDDRSGYFLPNHTIKKDRAEIVEFVKGHMSH